MLAIATSAMAQETYESAQIATEDLKGTARYIGMGGAMEALGADISTISTNPAGLGMFRHSWAGMSMSLTNLPQQNNLDKTSKTVMGFDQLGFVVATRTSEGSYLNFAANYHKSRNFNQILPAIGALNEASMNKHSYIGAAQDNLPSQVDKLMDNTILVDYDSYVADPKNPDRYFLDATDYEFRREQKGYIGEYNISLSGNHRDRIYWGITAGLHDVHYKGETEYNEYLISSNGDAGALYLNDLREITGTGFDIKAGVIIRPIEYSPFRVGISISTPTWYTLTSSNDTYVHNGSNDGNGYIYGLNADYSTGESYKYRMDTPWKFGLSLGHTIDNTFAIGASYEYADYTSIDNRVITDEYYDYYYGTTDIDSESDRLMNRNTERCLDGVHTLKVGAEYKLTPEIAVRAGYNYVSPMYKKSASRDFGLDCDGVYYSSTTDYTNWKDTQRLTLGLGYSSNGFSLDLAYLYNTQNGDFHPFPNTSYGAGANGIKNIADAVSIKNERHQFMMTLGYRF